jgi:hypothetical protein
MILGTKTVGSVTVIGVDFLNGPWLLIGDLPQNCVAAIGSEWRASGAKCVQYASEAEEIGRWLLKRSAPGAYKPLLKDY